MASGEGLGVTVGRGARVEVVVATAPVVDSAAAGEEQAGEREEESDALAGHCAGPFDGGCGIGGVGNSRVRRVYSTCLVGAWL